MKKSSLIMIFTTISFNCFLQVSSVTAQDSRQPVVQDLEFLIGTWELSFEHFDTHKPERGVISTETGKQVCEYDLTLNDKPMFITCKGELKNNKTGRIRTFQESIRYGSFVQSFERIGLFSNWPATSQELLSYDAEKRKIEIKGQLNVQDGMLERYEDIFIFNEDFSAYERKNIANFSDMPITLFNPTFNSTAKKIK